MTEHRIARALITAGVYAGITLSTWSNLVLWVAAAVLVVILIALWFIWRKVNEVVDSNDTLKRNVDELTERVDGIHETMKKPGR